MEPEELQKQVKEAVKPVMTAFEEFKSTNDARLAEIEKKKSADVITTDKLERIEKDLAGFEGLNQKLTLQATAIERANNEVKRIETLLNRAPGLGGPKDEIEKKKMVDDWARAVVSAHIEGVANLSEDQRKVLDTVKNQYKVLNVSTDSAGGYLAPVEYVADIIKAVTLMSPVRSIVRVRQTAAKAISIPKRTARASARRVTEQGTKTETTGLAYGLEEINAPEMYALIDISNQMLEDSAFNMGAEIQEEASDQFAILEGSEFINGVYGNQMEGILTNASMAYTASGSAATIADGAGYADGILGLKHGIKSAYAQNAKWIMNRTVIGSVRKLKNGQGAYIWMPGIANSAPNTIDGDPYVEFPDMPNEGAGAYPIAYGDWQRAYTMVDRISMEMLRDPYTQATAGNVRFIFRRRGGGKLTLAEAVRKLKCATS